MKIKNIAIYAAAIAATLAGANNASAAFGVNLSTTLNDGSPNAATRLYNDAAFTDASEVGDPLWLVFDVDGDGIFASGALANPSYDGTATGLRNALIDADDYVIFSQVNGPLQGRNATAFVGLPSFLQTGGGAGNEAGGTVKPAYALIFDDANIANGVTFGVNGALTADGLIPGTGNVTLRIGENTAASTYSASVASVVIPEPITGVAAALALGGLALIRRRGASRA